MDKGIDAHPYKEIATTTKMWSAVIISTSGSRGSSTNILVGTLYLPPDEEALKEEAPNRPRRKQTTKSKFSFKQLLFLRTVEKDFTHVANSL